MKSILPKKIVQSRKKCIRHFIGPNTKVILLTSNHVLKLKLTSLIPQKQGRDNYIPEKALIKEKIEILPEYKEGCNYNVSENILSECETGFLEENTTSGSRTFGEGLSRRNLDILKSFIYSYTANPEILHNPKFDFYREYLEGLGVIIPNSCEMRVPMPTPLAKNIIKESISGEYNCAECDSVFITQSHLECHMKSHTEKRSYQCSWCRIAYTTHYSLKIHFQNAHAGEKPYKCSQCNKTFKIKKKLVKHMRLIHIREKPYKCLQCNESFSSQLKLRTHMTRHFGMKQYQCNQCGKAFLYKQHLVSHVLIHTGERPYKCSQCGISLPSQGSLKQHMRTHIWEQPYKCNQCDKTFKYKIVFIKHTRMMHARERPYKCLYCDKAFLINSKLIEHMALHTGVKPNWSTKTSQSFAKGVCLKDPTVIPNRNRSFQCSQCGKTFTTKLNLTKHIRYNHIGARQAMCIACCRVFVNQNDLIDHMRVHTGERLHESSRNYETLAYSDKLENQREFNIEVLPYSDNQFENASKSVSSLNEHIGTCGEFTDIRNDVIIFPESTTGMKQEINNTCISFNSSESEVYNPEILIEDNENLIQIKEEIVVKAEKLDASKNFLYSIHPIGESN